MKLKKFASLFLALAMVFALAVPAFASDITYSDKASQNVTMKGATTVPKVQIALPSGVALTNSFLLNPYKVGYSVKIASDSETTVAATAAAEGGQVISPILSIANGTLCKLKIDVTVTTTLGGNLKLMTADFAEGAQATDTKNDAFLFVNMKYDQDAAATSSSTDFNTAVVEAVDEENKLVPSIILKAGDVKKTKHIVQAAATASGDNVTPNYIWMQFGGNMAEGPTTPWTDKDIATVAFAFTFTPDQNAVYASE